MPLFAKDEPVAGGLLRADLERRRNPVLEVILLGHGYAPEQNPVETLTVRLSVGSTRPELIADGRGAPERRMPGPGRHPDIASSYRTGAAPSV
jgi:hypothetical protein